MTRPELGRARWKRIRRIVLERDGHTCELCGAYANTVDHVLPAVLGGDDSLSNLRALCRSCNSRLGARVRAHMRAGRAAGSRTVGPRSLVADSTPASSVGNISPRGGGMRHTTHIRIPGIDDLEEELEDSDDDPDAPDS